MNTTRSSVNIEEFSSTLTYIELVLIGIIMIIICVVTFIGNALVLISFILDKKLRTLTNYFLLSLAVSDIMVATFSMPLFIAYLLIGEWTLGQTICDIWLAQDYTCGNASFLNLLMIAIDRYFSVTNPLGYRAKRTGKRVGIMISCVWIMSFLLWPPWIYGWPYIEGKRTVPEDDCYVQFLETNTYVTIVTAVIDYYVPVTILLILYYKIWRVTKRRSQYLADMETGYKSESMCLQVQNLSGEKNKNELLRAKFVANQDNLKSDDESEKIAETALLTETADSRSETKDENEAIDTNGGEIHIDIRSPNHDSHQGVRSTQKGNVKSDNKATKVLSVILLAFIVTTTPYNLIVIIMHLDSSHSIVSQAVWNFCYFLFYVNSTLNPLCYALANENFRKTYWRILTCSWSRKSPGTYSISSYSDKSSESKVSHTGKLTASSSDRK